MKEYLIVIERSGTGFAAYSPDIQGCVATGSTYEEVQTNMREAIEFHAEGLRMDGEELPEPSTSSAYVRVSA
jgi:predicted RNase H-like HicB family nuclease